MIKTDDVFFLCVLQVMHEYKEVETIIQNLNEFMKKKTIEMKAIEKDIEILKEKWLQPLEQLVEQINANFSSYFSAMNCAGEVTLAHGEDVVSI